jgi:hypothetical protein
LKEVYMCDHDHDGPNWQDIGLAGALAEEISKAELEAERIRREIEEEQEKEE